MEKIILRSMLSPGDIVMLTAAVRDLHAAHPGRYQTDVRTACPELWENNPHITPIDDSEGRMIDMHYDRPTPIHLQDWHFVNGYRHFLEYALGIQIPQGPPHGDIHLSEEERIREPQVAFSHRHFGPFWIIVAGGKTDFTCKLWERARYQAVVDALLGRVQFVQIGEKGHDHRRLSNVISLLGKTNLRQFVNLVHHADGVLCPVTAAMHLAAAVPVRPGKPPRRCVVVAGAREPVSWEKYAHHEFLAPGQDLPCAVRHGVKGACWRSRVVPRHDGSDCDLPERICERPVCSESGQIVPECMDMVTVPAVVGAVERLLLR